MPRRTDEAVPIPSALRDLDMWKENLDGSGLTAFYIICVSVQVQVMGMLCSKFNVRESQVS